jgi:Holliday junction resolvase RusA-like endonuclease
MTSPVVSFTVHGTPMPQGSMKAFNAGGRAMVKPSGGLKFAQWRNAVAEAASRAAAEHGRIDGPVQLVVAFRFPMPKSRPAAVRKAGIARKTTAPDLDKLLRAVGDTLVAGGLLADDAQIAGVFASKWETTDAPGAAISVATLLREATA